MKRLLPLLLLSVFCYSCNHEKVIYIQPLGKVNAADVALLKSAIEKFYHYPCRVKPAIAFSPDILADSKIRYDADRILSKYDSGEHTLIITGGDIATANPERHVKEWGIFGRGYTPGNICVVSIFRLKPNGSGELYHERLIKVCLHEIGHNFGLPHCSSGDMRCLMQDARGVVKQVDREQLFLCAQCRQKLCDAEGICKVN